MTENSQETFGQYGKHFQEMVVSALLNDHRWAEQVAEVIQTDYFEIKYLQFLSERFFAYYAKYKTFPTFSLLISIIKDELKTGTDAVLREQIIEFLQRIKCNPNPGDIQFVKEKCLDFCRKQSLKSAFMTAIELMETEKYEAIIDTIKHAVSVGTTPSIGHNFFDDFESRFVQIKRQCIPTGITQLDDKRIFDGGLGAGEVGVICAATGVGKCVHQCTTCSIRYEAIVIDGRRYDPWDVISTQRGTVRAQDLTEFDVIVDESER